MYYLRAAVRTLLWLVGLVVAALCLFVVSRIAWQLAHYLNRTIFAAPW
jgi:hypothetical protein